MMVLHPIKVECYAGHTADERPLRFTREGVTIEVAEIVDRWYEGGADPRRPRADYFKVLGDDGMTYLLRHGHKADAWFQVERGDRP